MLTRLPYSLGRANVKPMRYKPRSKQLHKPRVRGEAICLRLLQGQGVCMEVSLLSICESFPCVCYLLLHLLLLVSTVDGQYLLWIVVLEFPIAFNCYALSVYRDVFLILFALVGDPFALGLFVC